MLPILYMDANWVDVFDQNQLTTFDDFWTLELPLVDEANHGRGGYSIVSRYVINLPDGSQDTLYIKRQQDYTCSSWKNPFFGILTYEREFINWQRFKKAQVATYDLLYFAKRRYGNHRQAILVSRGLPAVDLATYLSNREYGQGRSKSFTQRKEAVYSIASLLCDLHTANLQHGHLTPKHIFIGGVPDQAITYLIDLEVVRQERWKRQGFIINDLSRLSRHLRGSSITERMRFFKSYLKIERLDAYSKRLWRVLTKRASKSGKQRV